jgi:hypothetical protein
MARISRSDVVQDADVDASLILQKQEAQAHAYRTRLRGAYVFGDSNSSANDNTDCVLSDKEDDIEADDIELND